MLVCALCFVCSCSEEVPKPVPQFASFEVGGATKVSIQENFISIQMPFGEDVSALRPTFSGVYDRVLANGEEQLSGTSIQDFSRPVKYTVVAGSEQKEYIAMVTYSELPILYINTAEDAPIQSKETWVTNSYAVLGNTTDEAFNSEFSEVSIKGRGNSSWTFPKKSYNLKLKQKASVLGFPAHKRWCLIANWMDRTMLRNLLVSS